MMFSSAVNCALAATVTAAYLLLLVAILSAPSTAICPHARTDLASFAATFPSVNANSDIVIAASQKILFDVSQPLAVKSLNISGELIFKNANANLTVEWIKVNSGGKFIMGSADQGCALTAKIYVTFTGNYTTASVMGREPTDGAELGAKGLAVTSGGTLEIFGTQNGPTWTRLVKTANAGDRTIYLEDSVANFWKVGDKIVVATTDYGPIYDYRSISDDSLWWSKGHTFPDQTEERTIVSISGNAITLDSPLSYLHWGADFERAEVGLLTRNIVFEGDDSSVSSEFGGHFMIRKAASVQIFGVEFTRFGQKGIMGRYPVHFHMIGNAVGLGFYIRNSSIHHCFQRCVAIHDSMGILIENNVAFSTFGHCYFLEDGPERLNVFNRNLGISVKAVGDADPKQLIKSDSQPSVFWITNPNNTWTNNAAVSAKHGYWFGLPDFPTGQSASHYSRDDPEVRPRLTRLGLFDSNSAHSMADSGLFIDDMPTADDNLELAGYTPRYGPYYDGANPWNLPKAEAHFTNFVSYKNRGYGVWTRGGPFLFNNIAVLDNKHGFNAVPHDVTILQNSLIVGETDNIGTPRIAGEARSLPDPWGQLVFIKGFEGYDNGGPQYCSNVIIANFTSTPDRPAGAFGTLNNGPYMLQTKNRVQHITLVNSNAFFLKTNDNTDNHKGSMLLDLDGSVTGKRPGAWIVANQTFLTHSGCEQKPEWADSYLCPLFAEGYNQLVLTNPDLSASDINQDGLYNFPYPVSQTRVTFYRMGSSSSGDASLDSSGATECRDSQTCNEFQYMTNLISRKAYTVRFTGNPPTPPTLRLVLSSSVDGDWIVFAVPYPSSAQPFTVTYDNWGYNPIELQQASSISEMVKGKKKFYYYDAAKEHLYVYIENMVGPKGYETRFGFTDYSYDGAQITIQTSCGKTCTVSQSNLVNIPLAPTGLPTEDRYQARLENCEDSSQSGVAFFFFNPDTKELHYNINHDVTPIVTSVKILNDAGRTAHACDAPHSPVRGRIILSHNSWVELFQGKLSVEIKTSKGSTISGKIQCSGASCTTPAQIADISPSIVCSYSNDSVLYVYHEALQGWPEWSDWSWNGTNHDTIRELVTDEKMCGSASYKITLGNGAFSLGHGNQQYFVVDTTEYSHFEYFAKSAPGFNVTTMRINIADGEGNDIAYNFPVTFEYINNYVIDDTKWTRVRIPLSVLNFPANTQQSVGRVDIKTPWESDIKTFYVDEIRFIKSTIASDTIMTPPTSASTSVAFNPSASRCSSGGGDASGADSAGAGIQDSDKDGGIDGDDDGEHLLSVASLSQPAGFFNASILLAFVVSCAFLMQSMKQN